MFGAPITFLQYFKKIKPGADKGKTLFELAFRYHFRQSTLYIDSYSMAGNAKGGTTFAEWERMRKIISH